MANRLYLSEACQEILDELYPSELGALTDDAGKPDKPKVTTWMQHKGFGGSNARQMAATYVMIAEGRFPRVAGDDSRATETPGEPMQLEGNET